MTDVRPRDLQPSTWALGRDGYCGIFYVMDAHGLVQVFGSLSDARRFLKQGQHIVCVLGVIVSGPYGESTRYEG